MRVETASRWTPAGVFTRNADPAKSAGRLDLEGVPLLAAGMAHKLNNLLTGMICGSEWAMERLEDHPAREALELVARCSGEAAELVRQLTAYSGIGPFAGSAVDLSALAAGVADSLRASIPRRVQFRLDLAADLTRVRADEDRVRQLVHALLANSVEAIGREAGVILVRTSEALAEAGPVAGRPDFEHYVCLEVTDTGCGMEDAVIRRIFEPFFSTKAVGRGLGLAAVAGIVRSHQGSIMVESAPGSGSTFRVRFPVWPPDEWAAEEKAA